jgi:hypothetical protein
MRGTRVWRKLLRLHNAVVQDVWMGDSGELVDFAEQATSLWLARGPRLVDGLDELPGV